MTDTPHEFSPQLRSRDEYLNAAFDRQPDVNTASSLTGLEVTPPKETLGRELEGVFVPKGSPDAEALVVLVYSDGLSVCYMDLGNEDDAQALLADQFGDELKEIAVQTDVNGNPAVAWTACDVALEHDERGLEVPGTGIVLTASQVMWTEGQKVSWVTHPSLEYEMLLQVARSIG